MSFNDKYFSTHIYENVSFAKFSQYLWANSFHTIFAQRDGKRNGRLLKIGSGLGHLAGQLEDHLNTIGIDLNLLAIKQSESTANKTAFVGIVFLPMNWGGSMMVIARQQ